MVGLFVPARVTCCGAGVGLEVDTCIGLCEVHRLVVVEIQSVINSTERRVTAIDFSAILITENIVFDLFCATGIFVDTVCIIEYVSFHYMSHTALYIITKVFAGESPYKGVVYPFVS